MKYIAGILFILMLLQSYFLIKIHNENEILKIFQDSSTQSISGMTKLNALIFLQVSKEILKDQNVAVKITQDAACGLFTAMKKSASNKSSSIYEKENYLELKEEFEKHCVNA